ncbi:MAG: glycosyltransferase family 2 protein [Saccharofermentans sp.]|nr:glycosyltransferase family 2 protein [Saccharofermentans sp.]
MISVIVPVYNVEDYLPHCLDSIINQTFIDFEALLIDDGSTDSSGIICDNYASLDKRFKCIHITNSGVANARNIGINNASGDYLTFIDSDDYVAEDYLEYLYTLAYNNNADISVCGYSDNNLFVTNNKNLKLYSNNKDCMSAFFTTNEITSSPWCKLFKVSIWKDIRFDMDSLCEDAATLYKVIAKTNSIVVGFDRKYFYRKRDSSATNKPFSYKDIDYIHTMEERSSFIYKNYPELIHASNAYIIYAANLALIKMAKCKIYKSEYHSYLQSLYKKYEIDFLKGHSSFLAKIFSYFAWININTAMRFYRITNNR